MIDKIDEKNLNTDTEELNNICDECKEEDESVCLLYTSPSPRDP